MRKQRAWWAGTVAIAAVVMAGGCKPTRDTGAVVSKTPEGTSTTPSSENLEKRELAVIRVINAIPGGAVTIYAGDSAAFTAVAYKTATKWHEIPDNLFDFKLRTGGPDTEPLAENRENLQEGGHYTIVALPDQGGADKRNLRVLDDDLKPVSPDKARVRLINGVPSDQDVDLVIRGRRDPLFDGVNFKKEAGWDDFDPIAGTLAVKPDNKETVLASLPNVKLEGGKSYTFVFSGKPGKYELIKIEDDVAPKTD
jgi:hypothetical protein